MPDGFQYASRQYGSELDQSPSSLLLQGRRAARDRALFGTPRNGTDPPISKLLRWGPWSMSLANLGVVASAFQAAVPLRSVALEMTSGLPYWYTAPNQYSFTPWTGVAARYRAAPKLEFGAGVSYGTQVLNRGGTALNSLTASAMAHYGEEQTNHWKTGGYFSLSQTFDLNQKAAANVGANAVIARSIAKNRFALDLNLGVGFVQQGAVNNVNEDNVFNSYLGGNYSEPLANGAWNVEMMGGPNLAIRPGPHIPASATFNLGIGRTWNYANRAIGVEALGSLETGANVMNQGARPFNYFLGLRFGLGLFPARHRLGFYDK